MGVWVLVHAGHPPKEYAYVDEDGPMDGLGHEDQFVASMGDQARVPDPSLVEGVWEGPFLAAGGVDSGLKACLDSVEAGPDTVAKLGGPLILYFRFPQLVERGCFSHDHLV